MSFTWVSAQKCREKAEQAWQFDGFGDENDRDLFRQFTRDVGDALCSRDSGITFIQRTRTSSWVVRDDCPWAIGFIAYTDNRESKVGGWKPTYCVHAWSIINDKYSSGSTNRHTKTSTNFDTALKLAKTYLRRPSPATLASVRQGTLQKGMRDEFEKVRKGANETATKVVDIVTNIYGSSRNHNKRLYKELKNLLDMGHSFLDPEFKSDVEAMILADETLGSATIEDVPFYCVMTYESRDQTVFDVVKGTQSNPYHADIEQAYLRYTEDKLPEDITRKLAVLQMLDSEDFVDGVGVSAGNGVYYVVAE
tara:strand:+ start:690 stop:1613 length:924 start_codon:yes stop_codon:yes gene_type:complete